MTRPDLTGRPVALFVFSNLREQKFGLTKAWLRRLRLFDAAGWDTHVATIHLQPEIDETLAAWVDRGWLPAATQVHHFPRRNKRYRPAWNRRTDDVFTRDDRIAAWLDWLVGRLPGVVVFADSPVTYAPVAKMCNPYVGRIMTLHLVHRGSPPATRSRGAAGMSTATDRRRLMAARYGSVDGQPKLTGRFLPYAAEADAVVALTQGHALDLREDLPGVDVRVIPNMIDPPGVPAHISRDPRRIVYLGRLVRLKRVDHAIRAVARAARDVPGIHMDVFGRGPDLDRLVRLRDSLGLQGVVEFRSFTSTPEQELAGSALSTMTARREPFGLTVAESLAVGTPVVTYAVDYGPRELVTDGVNGRVVQDGSIAGLAEAFVELLGDAETWSRMSAAAPAAVDRLHPDLVGRQWVDLATEVAARPALPAVGLLIEDLRVRREGITASGVVIATDPASAPRRLLVPGGPNPGPALEWAVGRGDAVVADGSALLPRELVRTWPVGATLMAVDAQGRETPVRAPGVSRTVVPTDGGPVILSADASGSLVRAPDPDPVALLARPDQIHAALDDDVAVLTDALAISGRLVGSGSTPAHVVLRIGDPGFSLSDESSLAVVARTSGGSVRVGEARLVAGTHVWADGRWEGRAELVWDVAALAGAVEAVRGPVPLSLASGHGLHAVGPLEFAAERPLPLLAGGRWALAPGRTGRLLLVPGSARRVRASFWLRHFRRKRPSD